MQGFRSIYSAGVMALLLTLCIGSPAQAQTPAPSRDQARTLASSGKLGEALPLYDTLTASGSTDLTLYAEAATAAKAAGDMKRLGLYSERQVKVDPGNLAVRMLAPLAYQVGGDDADALRTRQDYLAFRRASSDPAVRASRLFMIDQFHVGPYLVNVLQCPEIGGNFGVEYMFDVFGPSEKPLALAELQPNHRERLVVEHDRATAQVAKELKTEGPAATLDALSASGQALLRMFPKEPGYPELRTMVSQSIASDTGLDAKPPMNGAWGRVACEAADK